MRISIQTISCNWEENSFYNTKAEEFDLFFATLLIKYLASVSCSCFVFLLPFKLSNNYRSFTVAKFSSEKFYTGSRTYEITKMYLRSLGLILLSFILSVKSTPLDGLFEDQSVPPAEAFEYVFDSHGASANDDEDDESPLFIHGTEKFINISLSEEFKNLRDELSGKWNNYVLLSTKWKTTDLTYSVHDYGGFPEKKVDECIKIATGKWAAVAKRLKFKQLPFKSDDANIRLEFVEWITVTPEPAIACTPGPTRPGNMQFTLAIHWTMHRSYGMNAACILTHEMGHALGLDHSLDTEAIMYAEAPCEEKIKFGLNKDDIEGIQALYPDDGSPGLIGPGDPRLKDKGGRGGNTGSRGGNTGGRGDNTGIRGGNTGGTRGDSTGSRGGNTGGRGGDTGSHGGSTETRSGNTGSRSGNPGPRSGNPGPRSGNTGPLGDNPGTRSGNPGTRSGNTGPLGGNPGTRGGNTGPRRVLVPIDSPSSSTTSDSSKSSDSFESSSSSESSVSSEYSDTESSRSSSEFVGNRGRK